MKIKPDYYDSFKCAADKCEFTCCKEWNISVDDETLEKWRDISIHDKDCFKDARKRVHLSDCVIEKDYQNVIELDENYNCPFLNENKLCKLVVNYGEDILSHTCDTFPRQTNRFKNHTEYSLVSCCPSVIDIWNDIDKITFINQEEPLKESIKSHMMRKIRDYIIDLIVSSDKNIDETLLSVFYILLDIKDDGCTAESIEKFKSVEPICLLQDKITEIESYQVWTMQECNEILLDISENYRKKGMYEKNLKESLLLSDDISDGKYEVSEEDISEFSCLMNQYEHLLKNFLVSEIFTNSLLEGDKLDDIIINVEWIIMEYIAFRQLALLKWLGGEKKGLSYDTIKRCLVVISRMMGYEREDIVDYMKECFESLIWEWGYAALLIGKKTNRGNNIL